MKRTKEILITILSLMMVASLLSTPVFAADKEPSFTMPDLLFLSAPDKQQRRFDLNGAFDLWTLSNIYTPIIICTGDSDTLTITLSLNSAIGSKDYLDFMMIAAGIGAAAIFEGPVSTTTPYTITSSLDIKSSFGAVVLAILITDISDSMDAKDDFPLEFTITFDLAQTTAL